MKKIIIANFKMNPSSKKKASVLFKAFDIKTKRTVILCPPFPFLEKGKNYFLGAQNCSCQESGAHTGQVSASMLKSVGCRYVLIGHSERRAFFYESNKRINFKIKICLKNKLKPILCIGEKLGESKEEVLKTQLKEGLKGIKEKIIIAYEPVWAIGTGKNCTKENLLESYRYIKKLVPQSLVLYGGSVNSENSEELLSVVDGLLVGGASLDKKEFLKIIK